MKKILIWTGLILLLALLGVMIYFGFAKQEFFPTLPDQYTEKFTTDINGVSLMGTAVSKLGSLTNPPLVCVQGGTGDNIISNSYSKSGELLTLTSSAKVGGGICDNGIKVSGIFPKGTLKITCDLSVSSISKTHSTASCWLNNQNVKINPREVLNNQISQVLTLDTDNTQTEIWIWENVLASNGNINNKVTIEFTPATTSSTQENLTQVVTTNDIKIVQTELINQNLQDTPTSKILDDNALISKISQNTGVTEEKVRFILEETEESNIMLFVIGSVIFLIILLIIGIILMRKK